MKIRTRLTLQFMFITAGIFTLALLFIFRQFEQYTENEFFTHLESKARMTAEMVLRYESDLKPIEKQKTDIGIQLPSIGNISIFNNSYQCVFTLNTSASLVSETQLQNVKSDRDYRFRQEKFQALGIVLYGKSGKKYIVISEDVPDFSKLTTLRNILLLSFLLVIAVVAAGGWFYAGQALQPVLNIVNEVDNILPSDLRGRLQKENNHDEISHLVTTFNRLLDRIEHAFEMQRGFIANVSHELKNPIATMDAQLQLALNKPRSVEEYDKILTSLHEDIRDLTDTTDRLLQLAKIHSGTSKIEFSQVRLDELVYQSRDVLLKTHPMYCVNIEIKQLPDNEAELCIHGDELLLRSAFVNLMDNCCKFSDNHTVYIALDFNAKNQIEIRDKGQGISAEDLPYIFEPFFRSMHNDYKKGSGIGLSLVQSILLLHHISIEVQSNIGKGTTFLLGLPHPKPLEGTLITPSSLDVLPIKKDISPPFNTLKKAFKLFLFIMVASLLGLNCMSEKKQHPQYFEAFNVSQDWYNMLLDLVQYSDGYRPPVSARMYAYVGLAAWETSLPAMKQAQSAATKFKDLTLPNWKNEQLFMPSIALNATYSTLSKRFFPHTPFAMRRKQLELSERWKKTVDKEFSPEARNASEQYGIAVAEAIFAWSAKDTIGHQAFLYNYHPNYKYQNLKGSWQPQNYNAMPALLPYWGAVKTFVTPINEIPSNAPIVFSEEKNSPFFAQAMEVYSSSKPMTEEKQWIAEFWSDDYPNLSFCAASRWIAIAHQALEQQNADMATALKTYLKLGFALNDVAAKVWYEKYHFNLERPDIYIQRNIDASWKPLHDTPSFPSYPSGHSAFGAAAVVILSDLLGANMPLKDRSHENSKVFIGKPRTFNSFKNMADENAISRLYMGVHYRMDCEEGLRLGTAIGRCVKDF
jgi:signal transduction histidine kinase